MHAPGVREPAVSVDGRAQADWYKIFSLPDSRYVNTMSETDHKEMVRRTRNVAVGYSLSNLLKGEAHIDSCISLFREQLIKLINVELAGGVHLDKWINYLAFDIVGEATFSKSFGFLLAGHDIGDSISNQFKLRLYIAIVGHYNFLHDYLLANPLIAYFNLQPSMHIFDTCLAAVEARSKNTEVRNDMIEQWQQQRRDHPDRMAENEILAAAVANMGAGADTVSSVLQALFYYLLRDHESLQLLREEIDSAGLSDIPSYAEVRELPVLAACLKEAYRMHTPVGFGIPRVSNGATLCGRYFPKGVILSVSPWVIHRHESIWGADPETYNARRWLPQGKEDEERVAAMERYLIAFGSGYGTCPGKNLAHMEMLKTASLIVRDFTWQQVSAGADWQFETYFTSVPHDWPVFLERRIKK
jgi:hypothetical protein